MTSAASPQQPWIERTWSFGFSVELYPSLLERLRGTPARLGETLQGLGVKRLVAKTSPAWSLQQHAGHLLDLETLFQGRFQEFMDGAECLQAADMSNAKTNTANHDERPVGELLADFRRVRIAYMEKLQCLGAHDFARSALHPRLGTPMRLVDMCLFQADHDDHHLASMRALLR